MIQIILICFLFPSKIALIIHALSTYFEDKEEIPKSNMLRDEKHEEQATIEVQREMEHLLHRLPID